MQRDQLRSMLAGGTRRSLGQANIVAARVADSPSLIPCIVELLRDTDPVIRMRAADVAEKVSLGNPELLLRHRRELMRLLHETEQQELRWHLALIAPRLNLRPAEASTVANVLRSSYLTDRSSIVKTCAMQALAELAIQHAPLRAEVLDQLRLLTKTGTPAMQARGRKLLLRLEETIATPDSAQPRHRATRIRPV